MQLKNIVLFQNVDAQTIKKIESFTQEHKISKDHIVFYEGDEPKYLYLLVSGVIKLYKTSSSHKEVILKYFHENELIGEVVSLLQSPAKNVLSALLSGKNTVAGLVKALEDRKQ